MMRAIFSLAVLTAGLALAPGAAAEEPACWYKLAGERADEATGLIPWMTDRDAAKKLSEESGRPLMVFSGSGTEEGKALAKRLSFFFIVDGAMEFVPVLGDDPAAGVAYTSHDGRALAEPDGSAATSGEILRSMVQALTKAGREAPQYLQFAARNYEASKTAKAYFGYG